LALLAIAALGLGSADTRPAAAQPVGHQLESGLVEVQYSPYYRRDRGRYYRAERRAERRAYYRARERATYRRAYRPGRYSRYSRY
jgi:hypothetical protein